MFRNQKQIIEDIHQSINAIRKVTEFEIRDQLTHAQRNGLTKLIDHLAEDIFFNMKALEQEINRETK